MLVLDHNTVAKHVEDNIAVQYASLAPSIGNAERKYILPVIGKTFYTYLDAALAAAGTTALSSADAKIIELLQAAICNFAMALYVPVSNVQITDEGAKRTETETMKPAYKFQLVGLINNLTDRGYNLLEEVIILLTDNAADYPNWVASDEYVNYNKLLLKNCKQFTQIASHINRPALVYFLLRNTIYSVEQLTIKRAITAEVYDSLLATPNMEIINTLCQAIAFAALAEGSALLATQYDDLGINVQSGKGSGNDKDSDKVGVAPVGVMNFTITGCRTLSTQWLGEAINQIQAVASATLWPQYFAAMQASTATGNPFFNKKGAFSF